MIPTVHRFCAAVQSGPLASVFMIVRGIGLAGTCNDTSYLLRKPAPLARSLLSMLVESGTSRAAVMNVAADRSRKLNRPQGLLSPLLDPVQRSRARFSLDRVWLSR